MNAALCCKVNRSQAVFDECYRHVGSVHKTVADEVSTLAKQSLSLLHLWKKTKKAFSRFVSYFIHGLDFHLNFVLQTHFSGEVERFVAECVATDRRSRSCWIGPRSTRTVDSYSIKWINNTSLWASHVWNWDGNLVALTRQEEGDETGFFGDVESKSRSARNKLHQTLAPACSLQERQELLRLLQILERKIVT